LEAFGIRQSAPQFALQIRGAKTDQVPAWRLFGAYPITLEATGGLDLDPNKTSQGLMKLISSASPDGLIAFAVAEKSHSIYNS
jgi:hypothetical protein